MIKSIFGTDGIRGRVNQYPMTAEAVLRIGMAIALEIKAQNKVKSNKIIIGKDTRISCYMLESALMAGFTAMGINVTLLGPVPTPAVSMLTKSLRADLGVMLSASHNPYCDNGIKLFDNSGFKLSIDTERSIENKMSMDLEKYLASPEDFGRANRLDDAPGRYIEFVKNTFPKNQTLSGLKIVIDCANGAAYSIGDKILWELGANVIAIENHPNGFNINHNCGSSFPQCLKAKVQAEQADIGIALDGDADRVIICDEKGQIINGDQIITTITKQWKKSNKIKGNSIVSTIISSLSLESYLEQLGIKLIRSAVGDRYVMESMKKHNCNIGGEQSGHIILSDYTTTGDGLIAALQILSVMIESNKRASEVCNNFIPMPQIHRNIVYNGNFNINSLSMQQIIKDAENSIEGHGRIIVRNSGTENLIRILGEGEDIKLITSIVDELSYRLNKVLY